MNAESSTSSDLTYRPGMDPVFGRLGGLVGITLRNLRLQWFLYRVERRKARPIEAVGEMSAHMLRDIGAADALVRSTAGTRPAYERHGLRFGLSVVLLALVLAMNGTESSAQSAARRDASVTAQVRNANVPMAGVFAGEYVKGAPVYRFPAVVVTGSRKDASQDKQPCRQTLARAGRVPA